MFLTTTDAIDGHRIVRYLGIVGGESVPGPWSGATGKKGLHAAVQAAMDDMRQVAEATGANAVIGVRVDHEGMSGSRAVLAYGTAVYMVPVGEAGESEPR